MCMKEEDLNIVDRYYLKGYKEGLNKGMDYILEQWKEASDRMDTEFSEEKIMADVHKTIMETIEKMKEKK